MKTFLQFLFVLTLGQTFSCCTGMQNEEIQILKIDPSIKFKAEEKISYKDGINVQRNHYMANFYAEYFTNDKLDEIEQDTIDAPFTGSYYWKNDTLSLSVFHGDFKSMGFTIDISNDTTGNFHFIQCGHSVENLKTKLSDTFAICAKVQCTFSELIISKLPDRTEEDVIFGYANFKSKDLYYEGKDVFKIRTNMKFYFRASFNFYRSKYYKP